MLPILSIAEDFYGKIQLLGFLNVRPGNLRCDLQTFNGT